jgi:DNA invertase Pin-like site-specific DNA recombinase
MEIGYARVSTQDQHPALQLDALHTAGCLKVFVEQASGAQRDRPQLQAALDYARPGDTLVVWKLARPVHVGNGVMSLSRASLTGC